MTAAALALVGIFLPSMLLIGGVLPFWEQLRAVATVRRAVGGVNAGVVGLLAAGNDVFEGRWHYRCGPPRANRKETLDDAEFATWWATEARALLLMA